MNKYTVVEQSAQLGSQVDAGSLRSSEQVAEVGKLVGGSYSRRWLMALRRDAGRHVGGRRYLLIEMILLWE